MAALVVVSLCAVYASTTVSTAQGSNEKVNISTVVASIGGKLLEGTSPAVCTEDVHTQDVFVTGTNHQLYWSQYTDANGQAPWVNLGGYLTSSPAAASYGHGWDQVFVRGTNGVLWSKNTQGTANVAADFGNWFNP
jgi:hypothetical protein